MRSSVLLLCLLSISWARVNGNTCQAHSEDQCGQPGIGWNSGLCNSIHGGIKGNTHNLSVLINRHFSESFKFMLMASYFNSAEINRLGFHKFFQEYSDRLWSNGKDVLKYTLSRGTTMDTNLQVSSLDMPNYKGEVLSMSTSLDMMKKLIQDTRLVYKHAANKHVATDNPEKESYDPPLLHFLEEKLMEDYSDRIRDLAGKLNVLARIARNDKTKFMGFHLFDKSL
uniref:Ferritin n=1 Tax=Caligus clemensi TaxID=344056 RepID=C1C1L2_CALCM|nr:Ferritin light chain, oocyte isoform [Caligus clemensi]